jgi:hypothetical protein
MKRAGLILLSALSATVAVAPSRAGAATVTVTNTRDSGSGSLRHAMRAANANGDGLDKIKIRASGTIQARSEIFIRSDVKVRGPGAAKLAIRGQAGREQFPRPILDDFGARPYPSVTISDLTLERGGAGLVSRGHWTLSRCVVKDSFGHGVINEGNLTIRHSRLSGNGGGAAVTAVDFGIHGALLISHSTLTRNAVKFRRYPHRVAGGVTVKPGGRAVVKASTVSNNVARFGGGIFVADSGAARVTRSTLSGNGATESGGGVSSFGELTLLQTTLSGNSAPDGGAIDAATGSIESTIVANSPSGGDCSGGILSHGHNLADDGTCNLTGEGDQPNTEPMLRPLDDYGGPTKTLALRLSSPAVDAGFAGNAATDQRGLPRVVNYPGVPKAVGGDSSDIGAFELQHP